MVHLTKEERIMVVETYHKTRSFIAVVDEFQKQFPNREPPSKSTIFYNVNKYDNLGTCVNQNKGNSGRRKTFIASQVLDRNLRNVTSLKKEKKSSSQTTDKKATILKTNDNNNNNNIQTPEVTVYLKSVTIEKLNDTGLKQVETSDAPENLQQQQPSQIQPQLPQHMEIHLPKSTKPVAKVVHFTPKIIQVASNRPAFTSSYQHQQHFHQKIPAPKNYVPPKPSPLTASSSNQKKSRAPQNIIRVPRDNNIPLIVYNPPRFKAPIQQVPHSHTPVSVYPVATTSHLITLPRFEQKDKQVLPALIPTSTLQYNSNYPVPKTMELIAAPASKKMRSTSLETSLKNINNSKKKMGDSNIIFSNTSNTTAENNNNIMKSRSTKKFRDWSVTEVYDHFMESDCSEYAGIFKEQEIDGKALFHLNEMNISQLLGVKMGPAIKLSAIIKNLRECSTSSLR